MNNLVIRAGKPTDIESISQFQIAMAKETENFVLDHTTIKKGVSAVFRDTNKGQYLIAEQNNHIKNEVQGNESLKGIRLYVDKANKNAELAYRKLGMNSEHYTLFEWLKN